jgi:hypothetical protein
MQRQTKSSATLAIALATPNSDGGKLTTLRLTRVRLPSMRH